MSSALLAKLAAAAGVAYAEALTGFKWVVPGRRPPTSGFVFGYEEALGYCIGDLVRDKDGVTAALVAAELAADLRCRGPDAARRLDELSVPRRPRHPAAVDPGRRAPTGWSGSPPPWPALRADPPAELAGRAVVRVEDLLPTASRFAGPSRRARLARSTAPGSWCGPAAPSPSCKLYVEAVVPVAGGDVAAARSEASAVVADVLQGAADLLTARGL